MSACSSNWLVGGITALALLLLFWPLIGRGVARVRGRRTPVPEPIE